MKKVLGIYGAGGFGCEVMALLPSALPTLFPKDDLSEIFVCFIDDEKNNTNINGVDVLSATEFHLLESSEHAYTIAISDSKSRKLVFERMLKSRAKPITLVFDDVLIMKDTKIGNGSILMPGAKISSSVIVGEFVHINFNTYIAHDCVIENFVTVSPGVICCGNVIIGESAFIGAGSVIKQGTPSKPRLIGAGSTLGIGSNLISNIPIDQTYAGNPARNITGDQNDKSS